MILIAIGVNFKITKQIKLASTINLFKIKFKKSGKKYMFLQLNNILTLISNL